MSRIPQPITNMSMNTNITLSQNSWHMYCMNNEKEQTLADLGTNTNVMLSQKSLYT